MKNILFFLLPKRDIIFLNVNCSLKEALEVLEINNYSSVPLISDKGKYLGALAPSDLLWSLKNNPHINFENSEKYSLKDVPLHKKIRPARINEPLERIIKLSKYQNFIPVTDDNDIFIGIIRRRDVIDYLLKAYYPAKREEYTAYEA